jgi:hypothetical protein
MSELPNRMPPRPAPPVTKVPKVFSIWGTMAYGISSITALAIITIRVFIDWTPWYLITPAFLYVFISAGLICLGRIDTNKEAKVFIQALRERSAENKSRAMRKMN